MSGSTSLYLKMAMILIVDQQTLSQVLTQPSLRKSWKNTTQQKLTCLHFTTRNPQQSLMSSCVKWRQVEAQHNQSLRQWETRHARARDRTSHCDFQSKVERTSDFAELLVNKSTYTPPLSLPPNGIYVNNSRVLRGKKISKRARIFRSYMKKQLKWV